MRVQCMLCQYWFVIFSMKNNKVHVTSQISFTISVSQTTYNIYTNTQTQKHCVQMFEVSEKNSTHAFTITSDNFVRTCIIYRKSPVGNHSK